MDIKDEFFGKSTRRNTARRLAKLRRAGLLGMESSINLKKRIFYFITKEGLKTVYPQAVFFPGVKLKTPNPVHDHVLLQVRRIFGRSKIIHEYYTENMLAMDTVRDRNENIFCSDVDTIPDALFITRSDTKKFYNAVEVELQEKSKKRYGDKIQRYYYNKKIPYVIFISATKGIEKKVMAEEKRLHPEVSTKFYYGNLSSLRKQKLPFTLKSCHGIEFQLS